MNINISGILSACALAAASLAMQPALAQDYPNQTVRLVVPQSPGGTTDVLARALADRLGERWGQTVVVENISGAAGSVGSQSVASAQADGYTILVASEGVSAINPHLHPNQSYDVIEDFDHIATIANTGFYLIVKPDLEAQTVTEFIALAKDDPDAINYATTGVGSINHLVGELMKMEGDFNMTHIPHSGIAQAIAGIAGGQIEAAVASIPSVFSQVQGNSVRALAITTTERSDLTPDVPTVSESGMDGFNVEIWWGLLAPDGTDAAIVDTINTDVNAILDDAEFQEFLASVGARPAPRTPDEFAQLHADSLERWGRLVEQTGAMFE